MRLGVLAAAFAAPLVVSAALADIAPTPDRGPPIGDAGGLPFHWITDVQPGESVELLGGFARGADRVSEGSVSAIGLHDGSAAEAALERLSGAGQPESVRERPDQNLERGVGRN